MSTTIIPKKSTVASKVPLAGDLQIGEIALNLTDKKLYSKDGNSQIVEIGGGGGSMTASEILTAIKTVDGSTSGLDADLLDGLDSTSFATSAQGALADTAIQPNDNADLGNLSLTGTISGSTTFFDITNSDLGRVRLATGGFPAVEARFLDGPDGSYGLLNYAGNKKIEATSAGAAVTGSLSLTGDITVGGTVDGRDIAADGTKLDGIEAGADVTDYANVSAAGAVMTSGSSMVGTLTFVDGNAVFNDGNKALFGNSYDLQIYHDGLNSYIDDAGTGNLVNKAANFVVQGKTSGQWGLSVYDGAATTLYHNGAAKLATSSTGVSVTGTVNATAFTGDGSGLTNLPAAGIANVVEDTTPELGGILSLGTYGIAGYSGWAAFGQLNIGAKWLFSANPITGLMSIDPYDAGGADPITFAYDGTITATSFTTGSATLSYNSQSGSLSSTKTISAPAFVGDGSGLTNLPASAPSTAQVLSATAGASAGGVGTYVCAYHTSFNPGIGSYLLGQTIAGSNLRATNTASAVDGGALSGTWRAMGRTQWGSYSSQGTLWLRIA